jgi:hypothetical protein
MTKVRELTALLANANPEDNVLFDPYSQCVWLFNPSQGMFQSVDETGMPGLTERDQELLRAMGIGL